MKEEVGVKLDAETSDFSRSTGLAGLVLVPFCVGFLGFDHRVCKKQILQVGLGFYFCE